MCSSNTWNIKLAWWFQRYCQFHNGMMKGISNDGWHGSVSCFWCCKHAWNESVGRAPLGFPTKSSQHWQRLTPMFWPWLKLRPFRSFQYSMWCSATPRYFFYSMFNIFRYFAGKNDPNDPRHWSMEKPVLAMKHAACPWKVQGFPMGLTFFFWISPEMIIISMGRFLDISTVVCYISQWIIFPLIEKKRPFTHPINHDYPLLSHH